MEPDSGRRRVVCGCGSRAFRVEIEGYDDLRVICEGCGLEHMIEIGYYFLPGIITEGARLEMVQP